MHALLPLSLSSKQLRNVASGKMHERYPFHNVQEYLKQYGMAVESYSKGVALSEAHLGSDYAQYVRVCSIAKCSGMIDDCCVKRTLCVHVWAKD